MADRVEVAKVGELADGDMKDVDGGERTLVVLNVGGEIFAIDDECTHAGCPLSAGDLQGDIMECTCHGSQYNVRTGEVVRGPAEEPLPTYAVDVEDDSVYVTLA